MSRGCTRGAVAAKNTGNARESTVAVLATVTGSPRWIVGRLSVATEDVAQIGVGNFEAALRKDTRRRRATPAPHRHHWSATQSGPESQNC